MANIKFSDFTQLSNRTPTMYFVGYDGVSNVRISSPNASKLSTVAKTASYVILDNDGYDRIEVDTTSGDITITLPTRADNLGRRIEIANVKGGTNKVIIDADAGESKITSDGLAALWLPKIGDYIVLQECATSGFWEVVDEKITSHLLLTGHAGYGSNASYVKNPRFTTADVNVGNMFSENHSSGYSGNTQGLAIIANRTGNYSYNYIINPSGNDFVGFSKNSSQLNTNINTITATDIFAIQYGSNAIQSPRTTRLVKGDRINPHTTGQTNTCYIMEVIYLGQ